MKNIYWILALSYCLLVPGVSARAESPALHGGALLSCSGAPCVDITLKDGKHLRMLVGLGEANSVLDSAMAKELGLAVNPVSTPDSTGAADPGRESSVLNGVRLGEASLGDISVVVADIASSMKDKQLPQADGILGYSAFHDRLLEMNYKRQTLQVSDPLTANQPCPGFCGNVTTSNFGKNKIPALVTTGFSVNGKPFTARFDTLVSGTILIYPSSIAKLGLQSENSSAIPEPMQFMDGEASVRESNAKTESFGSKALAHNAALFFATLPAETPDGPIEGTVGVGLLSGHIVYIDLHSQHFWMTN
jgi:hypothetical protein